MGRVLISWFFPAFLLGMSISEEGGLLANFLEGAYMAGGLGLILIVVCGLFNVCDIQESFSPRGGGLADWLGAAGCLATFACFVVGLVSGGYLSSIPAWFAGNGTTLNAIYGVAAVLLVFLNWKAQQADRKQGNRGRTSSDGDSTERPCAPGMNRDVVARLRTKLHISAIFSCLFVFTLVTYMYDNIIDVTQRMGFLSPIPFSEWQWANKLSLAALALSTVKYIIMTARLKDSPMIWKHLADLANSAAAAFVYLLLERMLYPLTGTFLTNILIVLPMMFVSFILQFSSYIYILYSIINFFFPGAITAWREAKEQQALAELYDPRRQAREEYERKLDGRERALNALTGVGPFTDDEAMMAGRMGTQEYMNSKLYRDAKLAKFDKKNKK